MNVEEAREYWSRRLRDYGDQIEEENRRVSEQVRRGLDQKSLSYPSNRRAAWKKGCELLQERFGGLLDSPDSKTGIQKLDALESRFGRAQDCKEGRVRIEDLIRGDGRDWDALVHLAGERLRERGSLDALDAWILRVLMDARPRDPKDLTLPARYEAVGEAVDWVRVAFKLNPTRSGSGTPTMYGGSGCDMVGAAFRLLGSYKTVESDWLNSSYHKKKTNRT